MHVGADAKTRTHATTGHRRKETGSDRNTFEAPHGCQKHEHRVDASRRNHEFEIERHLPKVPPAGPNVLVQPHWYEPKERPQSGVVKDLRRVHMSLHVRSREYMHHLMLHRVDQQQGTLARNTHLHIGQITVELELAEHDEMCDVGEDVGQDPQIALYCEGQVIEGSNHSPHDQKCHRKQYASTGLAFLHPEPLDEGDRDGREVAED